MERRDFIKAFGLGIAATATAISPIAYLLHKDLASKLTELEQDLSQRNKTAQIKKRIWNELPAHCHIATYQADVIGNMGGVIKSAKDEREGVGIFLDDFYISVAHISKDLIERSAIEITEKGILNYNVSNRTMTIGGKPFDILVEDMEKDILIAKQRRGNSFSNFPCAPQTDIKYLDTAYIIGNPDLAGTNIREGNISDLDGYGNTVKNSEGFFGTNIPIHNGDSGCPVVNDKFELLGIMTFSVQKKFAYANRISTYLEIIKNL